MKQKLLLLFIILFAQLGFGQIGFQENIVTGDAYSTLWPKTVKNADFDGDGDLDVIVSGRGLNWYENINGLGHFGEKKVIKDRSSSSPDAFIHLADIDNDQDIDILYSAGSTVTVYKNVDSFGTFQLVQTINLGISSVPIFVTDINQDGNLDLVCLYRIQNGPFQAKLIWLENDGMSGFNIQENVITTSGLFIASVITVSDIDGDGDGDIILGYSNQQQISYLKNLDSNGTFDSPVTISTSVSGLKEIYTSDIDYDGDLDIISASDSNSQIQWYENMDGLGNFSNESVIASNVIDARSFYISDINGDNSNDIVYTSENEIKWQNNDGTGNFENESIITSNAFDARAIILSDIDGDGDQDLVSASHDDDKVAWYENIDGLGNYSNQLIIGREAEFPDDIYPADFDGDGDIDLLTNSHFDSKISWLENVNGLGFFGTQHIISEHIGSGSTLPYVYPVDIDGDNDIDIAVSHQSVLKWYENVDGQGNFTAEHIINDQGLGATIIRSADIDGDGDMDLVYGLYNRNKIFWHENINGVFGPEQIIYDSGGNNGSLTSLEISDFDGDLDSDIIASSFNTGMFLYYNSDGQGNFQHQYMFIFDDMEAVYPADIDGDGDNDIVAVDNNGGGAFDAVVWYRNDNGVFNTKYDISTLQIHGKSIHSVDLDNDGDMDVLTASGHSQTSGKLSWYENINGNGTFSERQIIHELFNLSIANYVNTADIDNDGNKDILVTYGNSGSSTLSKVSVFKNLGHLGNFINGNVNLDENTNGCDVDDIGVGIFLISSSSSNDIFATYPQHANGSYQLVLNEGNFVTKIENLPNYFNSNPVSATSNFVGIGNADTIDFCIEPIGVHNDANISVYPSIDDPRPGFDTTYQIVYNNIGTTQLSGDITFTFDDSKIQFLSASETVVSQTSNTLTFNYSNLNPFETRTIDLEFNVFPPPTTNINDILVSTATINPVSGDENPNDNVFTLQQTVIGSYDPNDIQVLEGDEILIDDIDKYLHYIIRFQNTGTASAINVRVEHILDDKLDWTTMQLQSLSHTGRVEITDGSDVEFIFNNINLPDSTTDEPNSHGFIAFKIKPKQDVIVGDIITGVADIYFDFNPPIITNTVATEVVEPLSVDEFNTNKVIIYPNPTNGTLNIKAKTAISGITIYDLNGRLLKTELPNTNSLDYQLNTKDLSQGIYFLEVTSNNTKQTLKFVKN